MAQGSTAILVLCLWLTSNIVQADPMPADVRAFARAPQFAMARLSADGRVVSYVDQQDGRQELVLHVLAGDREVRALKLDPTRERFRWCGWADAEHLLCGTASAVRKPSLVFERTRLYAIHRSGRTRELNTRLADPIRDRVVELMPAIPKKVLLEHDPVGTGYPELGVLDVVDGSLRRVVGARPPIRRWMSDIKGEAQLGIAYESSRASLHAPMPTGWRVIVEQSLTDPDAVGPIAVGGADHFYALKHHNGRTALFRVEVAGETRRDSLLFADPTYDVSGPVQLHPRTGELLSVRYVAERERTHAFTPGEQERLESIDKQLPNSTNVVVDRSSDNRTWLVQSTQLGHAPAIYVFDLQSERVQLLGSDYPELDGVRLMHTESRSYRARDGQLIPAYLTSPAGERRPGPAIVLPHGGPETRDWIRFQPLVQYLASEGYAVLQMNFRGSFGYGAGFAGAGAGQWGGVIHNDITDGARHLVDAGIADPERICIVGQSFGGFAALLGAVREPQWYACAASFAGFSDLLALSEAVKRSPQADMWRERLGASNRALWENSPLARAELIEIPIFLMHGSRDAVVPVRQSRRMHRALREANKEVTYLERGDCDHDMTIETCRIAFFQALGAFLRTHLGEPRRSIAENSSRS